MTSIAQERIKALPEGSVTLRLNGLRLKQIPAELAQLPNLQFLDLSGNYLTEIPEAVWELEGLIHLDVGNNRLMSVDAGIVRLTQLRVLDLSENRLSELPDSFGQTLRELYLYHNQLSTVPEAILRLIGLEVLDLSSNRIAKVPSLVDRWTALREFDLSNNELDQLPDGIGALRSLRILNLASNRLSSVEDLCTLTQLEELYLERNQLAEIPSKINMLSVLRVLSAAQNQFAQLSPAFSNISGEKMRHNAETAIRTHILGTAKEGVQYAAAPMLTLGTALSIGGVNNIDRVIDYYYKGPQRGSAISIKYPSGPLISLKDLTRKTAFEIAAKYGSKVKSQPAMIGWQGYVSTEEIDKFVGFSQELASRIPGAKIVKSPTGETIFHNQLNSQHSPDQRRVVIDLYDVTDKRSRSKVDDRLLAGRRYELYLYISAKDQGTVVAPVRLPSEKLPPGENMLSVHFVPLVRGEGSDVLPSQYRQLKLQESADSQACTFTFAVPALIETYRARLIISNRNRVLQTLILSAPVGDAAGKFLLDVETIVDPSFAELSARPPFDAAILINDSPGGVPGLTALQGGEAVFAEPEGIDKMTKALRDFILNKAAIPAPMRKYESKKMRELLYVLSRKGKELWNALPPPVHELLKNVTTRVQLVDVREGVYFPAEFVYRGRSPTTEAILCPNGATALRSPMGTPPTCGTPHEICEHHDDPAFICPLRMWGFGIVIERQPATGAPQAGFTLRDRTDLQSKTRENVFDRVVVAVSEKVTRDDANAVNGLVSELGKVAKQVFVADNWTKLADIVRKESPTLLVLLPHSGVDDEDATIPALELGGEWLSHDRIESENICGPKSAEPVMLLLGCDTDIAEIPFLNFIKRFKDCGTAMVMGTITQIGTRRTVGFVERFAAAAESARYATFGELLLQIRRGMLADGDGYALSLLAYGDSD